MAQGYHPMDDYLTEDWVVGWASEVVAEIEDYLAKHAAFEAFTDFADGAPPAEA